MNAEIAVGSVVFGPKTTVEPATAQPIRRAFSQAELVAEAQRWLNENYTLSKQENRDKFYERLGLLVDFVAHLFPNAHDKHN